MEAATVLLSSLFFTEQNTTETIVQEMKESKTLTHEELMAALKKQVRWHFILNNAVD